MDYMTVQGREGGFRFQVKNPPAPGARLLTTSGERLVFNGIGYAGMLECMRLRDSSQQLYFPAQISRESWLAASRKAAMQGEGLIAA